MRKLTTEEFITKANSKHNGMYDYTKTIYKNGLTKVTVICPTHGPFLLTPGNHLSGGGCKLCSSIKGRLTTEEFIKRSIAKHGDRFNYDKSVYTKAINKIIVTCPEHGDFETLPFNHMNGHGCFKCRATAPVLGNKEYLKRAVATHGDRFDYSKTKYTLADNKITVICKSHGSFKVYPSDHIKGNGGCKQCMVELARERLASDTATFITDATVIHGDTYDYSNVNYINSVTPVTIRCSEHGVFEQIPKSHLNGAGCFKCGVEARRDTLEDFKEKAIAIHKDRYVYDKVDYINTKLPVTIVCKEHGDFTQTPNSHLSGAGCPTCNTSKGEARVMQFLADHNIKYVLEYNIPSDNKYRYDFYLIDLGVLIEYDGIQHFKPIGHFGGREALQATIARDKDKNELAVMHNIPLIRIPYTKYSNLADYLLFKLSRIYKYRDGGSWYKNYLELCTSKQLPPETTVKDVRKYLTYKNPNLLFSEMGY